MKTLEALEFEDELASIQRVVVAVDLTKHSVATARYAAQIAKCFNASLYVAHVFAPETLYEFGSAGTYELVHQRRQEIRSELDDLTKRVKELTPVCESVFLEGEAAEQISALARDVDADLIVTASHHPTFLGRLFNLDKAPQIMHRAPCSVLVYHEKDQ
jgi:nucleotide-binding universal stress UspA family protein